MQPPNEWPGSVIDQIGLKDLVGKYLRTHRKGYQLLFQFLISTPGDRTEAEYAAERTQRKADHEAGIQAALDDYNKRRKADGLPPVGRDGEIIKT